MNWKQIVGVVVAVFGIALLFAAHSIEVRLDDGREQISEAESQVKAGKKLFSVNPVTKDLGNRVLFNSADKKINKAKGEVGKYETIVSQLRMGGAILIVVGVGMLFFLRDKKAPY